MKFRWAVATLLMSSCAVRAAELKPETLQAWDHYVEGVNARMQERLQGQGPFLWVDETADRGRQARDGGIVVAPYSQHTPKRVASGLIHHWMGATLIPNAKMDDVFSVLRDYRRYKDYYGPIVIDSKPVHQSATEDQFSMLMMNQSLFMKAALDSDYQSSYVQVDAHRWYSTTYTTRVQEIENYGQPAERKLPLGEGSGYIWRVYSVTRYQETEQGVVVEVEAIALSRDIPVSVRWFVDPIVRKVSKSSIVTSLRQTQAAISTTTANVAPKPGLIGAPQGQTVRSFRQ